MRQVLRRTPSASMLVAVIALVVAASGTAVAATKLVNGDKLIKKHSLSGNRLRNRTVTGQQIKLKSLGTVPSANQANNANALGGFPSGSYLSSANRIGTNGLMKVTGASTGHTVTLFTVGPFTVTMTCTKTASGTSLTTDAKSSEANSLLNDIPVATANTTTDIKEDIAATTSPSETDNVNIDFEAPSGAAAVLPGVYGVNSLGADCWAYWIGIH